MTDIQGIALIILGLAFALCLWQHINLGLAAIPAAFLLAQLAGIPAKEMLRGFPTDLVLLVIGVMYLWNHVQESGLADILVDKTQRAAGGRVYLLPWLMGALGGSISAIGALPAASFAIVLPVAIAIAEREKINPVLMGVIVIQGACVGGFSPLNPWANLISTESANAGVTLLPLEFFLAQLTLGTLFAIVAFFCFGGLKLLRRSKATANSTGSGAAGDASPTVTSRTKAYQLASAIGMLLFILLVIMKYNVGLSAFSLGFILQCLFKIDSKSTIKKLPWGIAIMIGGILLYVSLMEKLGALNAVGASLEQIGNPSLVRVTITLIGTIVANFESSSIAVLGLVVPIAVKTLNTLPEMTVTLQMAILTGSIVVMSSSPFHVGGALIMAESKEPDRVFKTLLLWVAGVTCLAPLLSFLL